MVKNARRYTNGVTGSHFYLGELPGVALHGNQVDITVVRAVLQGSVTYFVQQMSIKIGVIDIIDDRTGVWLPFKMLSADKCQVGKVLTDTFKQRWSRGHGSSIRIRLLLRGERP